VEDKTAGRIGSGLLVLLGVGKGDKESDADYLEAKAVNLRIFQDENGKMNRSLLQTQGGMLVVSQFTLLGNCAKGRRPSFVDAADPATADALYQRFAQAVQGKGIEVQTGIFGAMMAVSLVNDGPVTLILESKPS